MRNLEHTIRVDVTFPHDTSHQVKMVTEDFREFIQLFDQKNREYGSENAFVLGSAGQFADIWRKIGKLKTALWDKKPEQLTSEGTEEIIHDLMGHLFLTLQCLRRDSERLNLAPNPSFVEQHDIKKGDLIGFVHAVKLDEESFEDKPVPATAGIDEVKQRDSKFCRGQAVRNVNPGASLDGRVGVIVSVDGTGVRNGAEYWYQVNFGNVGIYTCSEKTLENAQ